MTSSCDGRESMPAESAIRPMEYPILKGATGPSGALPPDLTHIIGPEERQADRGGELARELEEARNRGIEQGRQMASEESVDWRQQRAAELTAATEALRASRDTYLAQVEKEVVRLALCIAERILHRESQLDPLLLSGAVRMALGQLADSTEVRLRVPAEHRELWTEMVRLMPGLPVRPQVVSDPELQGSAVVLESSLGTADLSVRAQLEEIERGFFDRSESRSEDHSIPKAGAVEIGKTP